MCASVAGFEDSRLWRQTLARQEGDDIYDRPREYLRSAFRALRARAAVLAQTISEVHPMFTIHDVTHLDALWQLASLILPEAETVNPAEAFVLGSAFLIHDLGMALGAYSRGAEEIREDVAWSDTIVSLLTPRLGRRPTAIEIANPDDEIVREAIGALLRERHAEKAARLIQEPWRDESGTTFLLEDTALRRAFGRDIGRIAASHWLPVSELEGEFGLQPLGSAAQLEHPSEWTVNCLRLACLVRIADAIHLDARRAPHFLRIIRNPRGLSKDHWVFQERLTFPQLKGEELVFTSSQDFGVEDAAAWWLCADTLRMVDDELRQVHELSARLSLRQLTPRAIAGAHDTRRLSASIRTANWEPVDATVRVSDVASLVRKLGGEQLYGGDWTVPLRELIQNATDAIRLRRIVGHFVHDKARVIVRVNPDGDDPWIEVEDNGIGMTPQVLTNQLLDFGESYWSSSAMRRDYPNALSRGFEPTGKYGIGFFSVFMWSDHVRVTSRRQGQAARETHILEFSEGLRQRALLRQAQGTEQIEDCGTRVRVWFRAGTVGPGGIVGLLTQPGYHRAESLAVLLARVAATLDCNLYLDDGRGVPVLVVEENDWLHMDGARLLARVRQVSFEALVPTQRDALAAAAGNLRIIHTSEGNAVGRVCLLPTDSAGPNYPGVITVGGLAATWAHHFAGVLLGKSVTAARNSATAYAAPEAWTRWATEQAELCTAFSNDAARLHECENVVWQLGGATADLPVARSNRGWLSYAGIAAWGRSLTQVYITSDFRLLRVYGGALELSDLAPNVLLAEQSQIALPPGLENPSRQHPRSNSIAASIAALAEAWNVDFDALLNASQVSAQRYILPIATFQGKHIAGFGIIVQRAT